MRSEWVASAPGAGRAVDVDPAARPRGVVDYALARRAALAGLATRRLRFDEVCDADAYLRRAARYHGEPTAADCPVCHGGGLVQVRYTFGDCFRAGVNGRARSSRELPRLAREHPEFRVFVVEVCDDCGWNHLVTSYLLGYAATPQGGTARAGSTNR